LRQSFDKQSASATGSERPPIRSLLQMATATDSQTPPLQAIPVMAPQQVVQRSIPTLERQIDDAVAARPACLDLVVSAVQIIDSAGLTWLLALHARLETLNVRLRLVNPSSIVADALLATRLDARLTIQNTGAAQDGGGYARG
jgi:anti-anti-sigma factor